MEHFFKHLGIRLLMDKQKAEQTATLLIVKNPDGSPRWICNSKATKPLFLKFYTINSVRSKLLALLIKGVFYLGLQKIIFNTKKIFFTEIPEHPNSMLDISSDKWALFTGTVGPNNKLIVYKFHKNKGSFYKIATSEKARNLLVNEEHCIHYLNLLKPKSFVYPEVARISDSVIWLEDISAVGINSSKFSQLHKNFLSELYKNSSSTIKLQTLLDDVKIEATLQKIEAANDKRIPKGILKKLRLLKDNCKLKAVEVAQAHGDFTPWNMYKGASKLGVYDWELSKPQMPIAFDAFHFIIQQGILIDRKNWKEIKIDIQDAVPADLLKQWSNQNEDVINEYLKLYFLIHIVSNLHLYTSQLKWHVQIQWMLHTWNEALSDCLVDSYANRKLMILDVFDFFNDKKYAAIKFPNSSPENLSEYSDIDLCVQKSDVQELKKHFIQHPLVVNLMLSKKSYMATMQLFLKDGSILSIDLLWKIMRKTVVMLDAVKILENVYVNQFGIKQMKLVDTVRYIGLFYGLNNVCIPINFKPYLQLIEDTNCKLDEILYCNYLDNKVRKKHLLKCLKKQAHNNFIVRIKHVFNYVLDCCRQFFMKTGMVITFSGVDGAGKSTVIQKVKFELEKKMRKRVVVLRHRPSLLPILSAWIKGKKRAEENAIKALPRQGNNNSRLSSLLRFLYYLTDFIIGQFYVYVKHVSRGHIVLYDRYYFDFISDSRRSNINLPDPILKAGYMFLMKPDLNIFLFANSKIILKRKQELDFNTINKLTDSYLNLFKELRKVSSTKYITIENINLRDTLDIILQKTSQQLYNAS